MHYEISSMTKFGIVMATLAVLLSLSIGIFTISKSTANDGVEQVQGVLEEMLGFDYSEYNQVEILGSQLQLLLSSTQMSDTAVLVKTNVLEVGKEISDDFDRYIQFYNNEPYINYGRIISPSITGSMKETTIVEKGERIEEIDSTMVIDNGRLKFSGYLCTSNKGNYLLDTSTAITRNESSIEYVNPSHKYEAFVIKDLNGEDIGVLFKDITE